MMYECYESSSAQKRLFLLRQLNDKSIVYNLPYFMKVYGKIDQYRFEQAFCKLIQRHEALRTSFEYQKGDILQKVYQEVDFSIKYSELDGRSEQEVIDQFVQPFFLQTPPLLRAELVRIQDDLHLFLFDIDHIITDGTSNLIIIKEFLSFYQGKELSDVEVQYVDFTLWQNEVLSSPQMKSQEEYWLNIFREEVSSLNLPTDFSRPPQMAQIGNTISLTIEPNLTSQIKTFVSKKHVTLFMFLLTVYNVILARYSDQEDLVIGTPMMGRQSPELMNTVGFFVNTIALRNAPEFSKPFIDFLLEVKANLLKAFENQDYQFEMLVDKLNLTRNINRNPLFDVMFLFQNTDLSLMTFDQVQFIPYPYKTKTAKFDLLLGALETEKGLKLDLEYSTELFTQERMEKFLHHFVEMITHVIKEPEIRIGEINFLLPKEKEQLLYDFNNSRAGFPLHKTIDQQFSEQVAKTPNQIALVFKGTRLTYRELNQRANQLAWGLREKGVESGHIVAVMLNRSIEMIVSILGILKAGAAYLPIDPEYPAERIEYMLEDSRTEFLITEEQFRDQVQFAGERIYLHDVSFSNEVSVVEYMNKPSDLVYLIYTSGSTGKPKGVMLEHHSLTNLLQFTFSQTNIDFSGKVLQFTTLSFDVSFQEIFSTLLAGGELHLLAQYERENIPRLLELICDRDLDILFLPVAFLKYIFNDVNYAASFPGNVQHIITAGEQLIVTERLRKYLQEHQVYLHNHYGPSETHVVTTHTLEPNSCIPELPPIGKPIANTRVYIVNQRSQLQPVGVVGELWVGGEAVGRGYLEKPDVTAEKFIANPFVPGEMVYKTGDLARWSADGNIEFIGRKDQQVKIRGFRVEIGEIESRLLEHTAIKEAIVVPREDESKTKYLIGYVIATQEISISEVRAYLAEKLPEYMVPSYFVQLEEIPLTPSGKIDRNALPELDGQSLNTGKEYIAPGNEVEERLTQIWGQVLGIEKISMNDNFFDLGGHSLKATSVVAEIYNQFNVEMPLREIFDHPTIRELAHYIREAEEGQYASIPVIPKSEYYPTSSAQKRMFVLHEIDQRVTHYNMPGFLAILGELNLDRLTEAFVQLVQRHDALRTTFELIDGQPMQRVHSEIPFEISYLEVASEGELDRIIDEFIQPFDLKVSPLFRVGLVNFAEGQHLLMIDMHHIISDGTSLGILTREFTQLYTGSYLPELRLQYKDFSVWQNRLLSQEEMKEHEEYWLGQFKDEIQVLDLLTDEARTSDVSYAGDVFEFVLEPELVAKVKKLGLETGTTVYMILLASYTILLAKYTGQEDIVVGSPIAGRPHKDLEQIIGMFVNTLAMRSFPASEKTCLEFLTEVKQMALDCYKHQDYQFEMLVEKLKLERNLARNPLFDTMFTLQNTNPTVVDFAGLTSTPYEFKNRMAKMDLSLNAIELDEKILMNFEYRTGLFYKETIERMARHLAHIITEVVTNPDCRIAELSLLTMEEKEQLLFGFNTTEVLFHQQTVQQLFEAQVERTPDQVALIFEDQSLTYRELNKKVNQLAYKLKKKGVQSNTIVGIMVQRSVEMIIGMLAVLKAGGAYLPIDPEFPVNRIDYMLTDSGVRLMLSERALVEQVEYAHEILFVKDPNLYIGDASNPEIVNTAKDLAYVIYTSGSTGKPKGVMIEHQSVNNFILGISQKINFTQGETIVALTTFSFDIFVLETFVSFVRGLVVVLANKREQMVPDLLNDLLVKHQVNLLQATPSRMQMILSHSEDLTGVQQLKDIIIGGEVFPDHLCRRLQELTNANIYNVYGPTETTVWSTLQRLEDDVIRIGKSLANTRIYILDKDLQMVPMYIVGDLYIGGEGLARGYLNQPQLTEERFFSHPLVPGERIYQTGDRAYWLADGAIQFVGRRDHQVKIRGYRIEIGEVESVLQEHPDIQEVVVIDQADHTGSRYLCAYLISDLDLSVAELRSFLAHTLPEYMIPAHFVRVDAFPMTPNGKIDRRGLQRLDQCLIVNAYLAPTNELEEKLVTLWSEILGVKQVGIQDSFFELGGNSLKAITLMSLIYKELHVKIDVRDLFITSTVQGLAEKIAGLREESYLEIEPVEEQEYDPLSSAQQRIYLLEKLEGMNTTYNMPGAVVIEGRLDRERLERAFNQLIKRHQALRTSFKMVNGEPVQKIHQGVNFAITDLEGEGLDRIIEEFIRPFNLTEVLLIRVGLLELEKEKNLLIFDMHHIISDGKSMEILINDLFRLYQGEELSPLKIQYRDFVYWQNQHFSSEEIKEEEKYWLDLFAGEIPVLNLATDYPRPAVKSYEGSQVHFTLDSILTDQLRSLARQGGATLYMTMLAAYHLLLVKYSGQEDLVIGSPIAGRGHIDLDHLIGVFVNTLAMRNKVYWELSFEEWLAQVKTTSLSAFGKQNYQFEMLVEKLDLNRDLSRNPLFDTMFVMQDAIEMEQSMSRFIDSDLRVTPYEFENKVAKFDLTLTAMENKESISCNLEYRVDLFKRETMERMAEHLVNILREVVANPERKLSQVEMLSHNEREQILLEFNQTEWEFPSDKTLPQLFEAEVAKRPEQVAVYFKDEKLTYGELNSRSNQLARVLRSKGLQADQVVAVMVERSIEMIVGIMAIIKAGGAYLPIDPDYPVERIGFMLEDSESQLLLTQHHLQGKVNFAGEMVDLDDQSLYQGDDSNLENICQPENLAYVIYTSGSTGKPKGVMIEHRAIINRLNWMQRSYPIDPVDTILQKTTFTFDVSVWELFWWALAGAKVTFLEPGGEKEPAAMVKAVQKYQVTTMHFVPSMLTAFLEYIKELPDLIELQTLKQVFASGEALTIKQVETFNEYLYQENGTLLHNLYGPTEASIDVSYFECSDVTGLNTVPIGKPIDNIQLYILDQEKRVQPVGVAGELHIAGVGLARGYLNRPELTAEKFVVNPLNPGERMYKTGDLTRWLPDGNIEFLGRIDHQVKIRGFRLELGEIETHLSKYPEIREVVVVDQEDDTGEKYLACYFSAERELTIGELREYLGKSLPHYMIPHYFIQLEQLPLTGNGKVNRKGLPKPELSKESRGEFIPPETEIEKRLAAIWSEVLKVDEIGLLDHFFELGGHSLKAVSVLGRIYKELHVNLTLQDLFLTPTVQGLAEKIAGLGKESYLEIEPVEGQEYDPLSSAQQRIYLLEKLEGMNTTYNMPGAVVIEGRLDRERLERAFNHLIKRHQALRTSFKMVNGELVQKIHQGVNFAITDLEGEGLDQIIEEFIRPFNLAEVPLLRVGLLELEKEKNLLIFDMHHIISDGKSMEILINDLFRLYQGEELSPLKIQYRDFVYWQNQLLSSEKIKEEEMYWLDLFAGEIPVLNLATDYPRPVVKSYEGSQVHFTLDSILTDQLRSLARQGGATLYMTMLAAYHLLLVKYSGQEDLVIGSPIAGRGHFDLDHLIGVFVNTLAMRNKVYWELSFEEWLAQVKTTSLSAFGKQNYQFEMLVEKLDLNRDLSRNPLFDTMFVMQDAIEMEQSMSRFIDSDLKVTPYEFENKVAKFDLTLTAMENRESISCNLEYRVDLFKRETMERMAEHLVNILREVVANPERKLSQVEMLSHNEREQILLEFNQTEWEFPADKTLPQLFEAEVAKRPEQIAVYFKDEKLTYGELNSRSNQLARVLRSKGLQADQVVAVMVERSLEMIVGIMAIIKAGGAYLPIDPDYPVERIGFMLEDSESQLFLTQHHLQGKVNFAGEMVDLDDQSLYQGDDSNLEKICQPGNLAYVIYTSGSTGKPKGVMIEHRAIINRLNWMQRYYPIDQVDTILQKTTFTFDVSVWELFWWALAGAKVTFLEPGGEKEPAAMVKAVQKYQVTTMHFVPSMLTAFLEYIKELPDLIELQTLKQVFASGEALTIKQVETFNEYLYQENGTLLHNLYGPTEASIDVSYFECSDVTGLNTVPIGKPIDNIQLYILDQENRVQPVGVAGELHIAGVGLARGYLNRPELTAEKFVVNPLNPGERMYKTGDLTRWLPDGNIEFLGRIDHQVKIRGFRLELGEIETHLSKYPEIREVVVVDQEDDTGEKYLACYFSAERELTIGELREYLGKSLPHYMIPHYFIQLEQLPLTGNGKVNRKGLPKPELSKESRGEFIPPETEIEKRLAAIWSKVLKVDEIGLLDHFFELGGHSLKATALIGKIYKEFNVELSLRSIFNCPRLHEMTEAITRLTQTVYQRIEKVAEQEYYEASSAQKRMYLLQQFDEKSTSYNMPGVFELEGDLDLERVEKVFIKLINRHESLRTFFETIGDQIIQKVEDESEFTIELMARTEKSLEGVIQEFVRPFDLSRASLLRVGALRQDEGRYILIVDMHHIISDGVSMGILMDEFTKIYAGHTLPELKTQYKDYTEWQREQTKSESFKKQEEYWVNQFSDELPTLHLPTDYHRPKVQNFAGDNLHFTLDQELTQKLKRLSEETESTLYMVLLSGINILLSRYSRQEDIIVGTPIAGRPHPDLENLIGMFVNTLAMRNHPTGSKKYQDFLTEIKETALLAYEHQDYQFEELVDRLNLPRDMSRNPIFDVIFTMQNMDAGELKLNDAKLRPYPYQSRVTKFDLTISAYENGDEIAFYFEYSVSLFNRSTIERMVTHLEQILKIIATEREIELREIDILTLEEKDKILCDFNATQSEYPKTKTICELFEEQAIRSPEQIAVVFEEDQITYKELNNQATSLAEYLQTVGIRAESIVGIMVERSVEMVVGILAILKAGGAYLPIDPDYPAERIDFMIQDCNVEVLLTQRDISKNLEFTGQIIDILDPELFSEKREGLKKIATPENLAYVIYTSGSTGQPKGVMIEQRGVIRLIMNTNYVPYTAGKKLLQTGTLAFDASTFEIWGALLNGMELHLGPKEILLRPEELERYLSDNQISVLFLTTALFNYLVEERSTVFKDLEFLLTGGEVISPKHVHLVQKESPDVRLSNVYGPTENTALSTHYIIEEHEAVQIPIGKPISNTKAYILDHYGHLAPIGVDGELCLAGVGVARGYINNPQLTQEKFGENPFLPGERIYRTGDLARWLPNGNIKFSGRIDTQVKINGFRIEPGEIENHLVEYPLIKEVVVIDKQDQREAKYLAAYIVADTEITVEEMRRFLAQSLPDYMIPAVFVQVDSLPLTKNGKVDKKALRAITSEQMVMGDGYQRPTTQTEEILVRIWEEILQRNEIGVNDNFFSLGGNSIKAMQMIGLMEKELGRRVSLQNFFSIPTVAELVKEVAVMGEEEILAISPAEYKEFYQLSYPQKRLLLIHQLEPGGITYNMTGSVTLHEIVRFDLVQEAVQEIVQRHESLRTYFAEVDGKDVQIILPEMEFTVLYRDISTETEKSKLRQEIYDEINQQPFDLMTPPLIKATLVKVEDAEYDLIYSMHHIISDGWSMEIMKKEFIIIYTRLKDGVGESLPVLPVQYKDFAVWQNQFLADQEKFSEAVDFWANQLTNLPKLNLPMDFPMEQLVDRKTAAYRVVIKSEILDQLKSLANELNTSLFIILLTGFKISLASSVKQNEIYLGLPVAGREQESLRHVIGFFINTTLVRNTLDLEKSFIDNVKQVQANTLKVFDYQNYPLELILDQLKIPFPELPIFFNMLNMGNSNEQELTNFDSFHSTDLQTVKFNQVYYLTEYSNGLEIVCHYLTGLFKSETIEYLVNRYVQLLEKIVHDPSQPIKESGKAKGKRRRFKLN